MAWGQAPTQDQSAYDSTRPCDVRLLPGRPSHFSGVLSRPFLEVNGLGIGHTVAEL